MTKQVAKAILEWWAGARFWTTGDYGEFNVFDEPPKFVRLAIEFWPGLARKYGISAKDR